MRTASERSATAQPRTAAPAARLATRNPPLKANVDVSDVVAHSVAVPRMPATASTDATRVNDGRRLVVPPQGQPDGDRRADEQGLGVAVRAVVGPRRIAVRGQEDHDDGRRQRPEARQREEDLQPPAPRPLVVDPA